MLLKASQRCGATSTRASAAQRPVCGPSHTPHATLDRRAMLGSAAVLSVLAASRPLPARAEDMVRYMPAADKTPALRSGVIKPDGRYSFDVPADAKELRVTNLMTGNFCMPNCSEPWLEAIFDDADSGKIQLLAIPVLKLTNTKNPKIREVGPPENLLQRIGSYLTGSYFDEDSVVSINSKVKDDGVEYYEYEIYQLDAANGPHTLTSVTSKGEVLYMLLTSANEKQWNKGEPTLRKVIDSFRA